MSVADHPARNIFAIQLNGRHTAAIVVLTAGGNGHRSTPYTAYECIARGLSTSLTNFGRIDAVDADFEGFSTLNRSGPQGVPVGDKGNFCPTCACVTGM